MPFIIVDFLGEGNHDIAKEVSFGESIELAASEAGERNVCVAVEILDDCEEEFVAEGEQGHSRS